MSVRLRVSARMLNWPKRCACCMRPADTEVEAEATRIEGKRVVRMESRSWQVPYCRPCVEHRRLADRAERYRRSLRRPSPSEPSVWQAVWASWFAAAVGTVILGACAGAHGVGPAVLVLFAGAGAAYFLARFWPARLAEARRSDAADLARYSEQRRRADDMDAAAEGARSPTCAALRGAVDYVGWHGTVHELVFRSADYASAFAEANAPKLR